MDPGARGGGRPRGPGSTLLTLLFSFGAGGGAPGFEAASRGAARVVRAEQPARVAASLRENTRLLGAESRVEIAQADAVKFASSLVQRGARFDVVFLDPPYKQGWIERLAPLLPQLLVDDGSLYVEAEYPVVACSDWQTVRDGRAGQVFYQLLRRTQHDGA